MNTYTYTATARKRIAIGEFTKQSIVINADSFALATAQLRIKYEVNAMHSVARIESGKRLPTLYPYRGDSID